MKDDQTYTRFCGAKTRDGGACRKHPIKGRNRCRLHGGLSRGPTTVEGREAVAAAHLRHGRYVGYRKQRERDKFYNREVKRILMEARLAGLL